MFSVLSVPLYWWPQRYPWRNRSRHKKITKNVILFKKAISVFSLLNGFTFRTIPSVYFSHIPWIINSDLNLHCHSWGGRLAHINKALSDANPNKGHLLVCQRDEKNSIQWVFSQVLTVKWKDLSLFLSLSLSLSPSLFFLPYLFLFIFLLVYADKGDKKGHIVSLLPL